MTNEQTREPKQTCDRCRHWLQDDGGRNPFGSCEHPKMLIGYHIENEEALPNGIIAEGDEGWGFITAPKFGCVNWETK